MNTMDERRRSLFEAARHDAPPAGDRARLRAALALRLPVDPGGGPGGAAAEPPASGGGASLAPAANGAITVGLGKLLFGGLVVGTAAFIVGYFVGERRTLPPVAALSVATSAPPAVAPAREAAPTSEPAPAAAPTAAPAPDRLPETPPSGGNAAKRAPGSPTPPATALASAARAAGPASTLAEEAMLLREAQAALRDGDAAGSLARLDDLASRHPNGLLREERAAAQVLALCAAKRSDDARIAAERFLAESPRSVHADRVRASCALAPAKPLDR